MKILARPNITEVGAGRGLWSGAVLNAAALLVQGCLRLGYTLSAARVLGPAEYGRFALALAIATVCAILWPASGGAAFSKFVSRERAQGGGALVPQVARHLVRRQAQFVLIASPVVMTVALVSGIAPHEAAAVVMLCVGIAGQGFGRGVHAALGRFEREAVLQVASGAVGLLTFHALLSAGVAPSSFLAVFVLGLAFCAYSYASLPRLATVGDSNSRLGREVDQFVMLAVLGSLASAGTIQFSVVVSAWIHEDRVAGIYAAAVSLAIPLSLLPSALTMVLVPRMAAYTHPEQGERLRELRMRVTVALGAVAIVATLLAGVILPVFVGFVLGEGYGAVTAPATVLVLAVLLTSVASPSIVLMSTRTNRAAAVMSLGAWGGLFVAASYWLASSNGPLSIAIGYLGGTWVTATVAVLGADKYAKDRSILTWFAISAALPMVAVAVSSESELQTPLRGLSGATGVSVAIIFLWLHWRSSGRRSTIVEAAARGV
ncbi:lipopolysaccharide biosynthesis protein [Nocardioides sediminis]|uniref:lipopolysaccharide biosynthesis protein n=1 Tax=Nocardioides sediminis TaxID=433648 RepID=UPI000D316FC7|nr:lipopolysaccharide biosynthesis protein [Nocardioides sediminis]